MSSSEQQIVEADKYSYCISMILSVYLMITVVFVNCMWMTLNCIVLQTKADYYSLQCKLNQLFEWSERWQLIISYNVCNIMYVFYIYYFTRIPVSTSEPRCSVILVHVICLTFVSIILL